MIPVLPWRAFTTKEFRIYLRSLAFHQYNATKTPQLHSFFSLPTSTSSNHEQNFHINLPNSSQTTSQIAQLRRLHLPNRRFPLRWLEQLPPQHRRPPLPQQDLLESTHWKDHEKNCHFAQYVDRVKDLHIGVNLRYDNGMKIFDIGYEMGASYRAS